MQKKCTLQSTKANNLCSPFQIFSEVTIEIMPLPLSMNWQKKIKKMKNSDTICVTVEIHGHNGCVALLYTSDFYTSKCKNFFY